MNLESEHKIKKKKKKSSSDSDDDTLSGEETNNDEGSNKKVYTLQKDMIWMEFKNMHKQTKGNELWCMECKKEGYTKGSYLKDQFCEICQIMGHLIKECPFNPKKRSAQQVFLTQESSISGGSENTTMEGTTLGGYKTN